MAEPFPNYDVIVLGGGAAGLMCAIEAGRHGKRVILLEHNERVGRKIEISGGGRCNFTNLGATWENYLSRNRDFCRSALARYTPWDFVALVEKHGIRYHEKTLGQQFCDGSSRQIIEMLLTEAALARVTVQCGVRVDEIEKHDRFRLTTSHGVMEGTTVVMATGGLSFPKLGATDFGYRMARHFGVKVTAVRPGLVPLTLGNADAALKELSGVSLPVTTSVEGRSFREAMLVTHRGLSGPAILQISSYWRENEAMEVDLMPDVNALAELTAAKAARRDLVSALVPHWPRRFAEWWAQHQALPKPLPQYKDKELAEHARRVKAWLVQPTGTEGYAKAEVTLGGIDTACLSSKTMEARDVRGLFFIGEVVDVTGWLGGYNFQWAWASGMAAGRAIGEGE